MSEKHPQYPQYFKKDGQSLASEAIKATQSLYDMPKVRQQPKA